MSNIHFVKILPCYFDYVGSGIKNAEVRYNDRDYKAKDWLILQEWNKGKYTGRFVKKRIMAVFSLGEIGFYDWVLLCLE